MTIHKHKKTDVLRHRFFVLRLISLVGISAASKVTHFLNENKSQADEIRTYAYVLLQTSSYALRKASHSVLFYELLR